MISATMFWPWLVASLVCIATPGPDMLSVLSVGVSRGRRAGMQFAAGVGAGCLTHTTWAAFGIAAVVAASEQLFAALKIVGAVYLLWLGIQALRASFRAPAAQSKAGAATTEPTGRPGPAGTASAAATSPIGVAARSIAADAGRPVSGWTWFVRGFVNNSLNPKVMLFFVAFIPQFVDARTGPVTLQMLAFGAGFAVITATAYVSLGWATGRVGDLLSRHPAFGRWLDRATGTLFVLLALRLAFAERR